MTQKRPISWFSALSRARAALRHPGATSGRTPVALGWLWALWRAPCAWQMCSSHRHFCWLPAAPLSTSPPLHLPPLQAPALPLPPAHPAQQEGQGCSSVVLAGFACFGKVLPALLFYNWLGELEDQSKVWPLFLSGERGGCCISFWVEMGHLLVAVSFVL